jgi:hypothetical protein
LFQKASRRLQICRCETFGKAFVNRSQQFSRLGDPLLISPEPCKTCRRPQFPRQSALPARLESSGMESATAERIATEICRAIARSTGAMSDLAETSGIERRPSEQIAMVIVDLIRQSHPA